MSGDVGEPSSRGEGVRVLATDAPQAVSAFLSLPVVAAALGIILGIGLVVVSRVSSRLVTPDDPALGFTKVAMVLFVRMVVAFGALALFYFFARRGFVVFGIALVSAFMCALVFEAFRASKTLSAL